LKPFCVMMSATATATAAMTTLVAIAPLLMYERESWMKFFILLAYYGSEIVCFFTGYAILTIAIVCLLGCVVTMARKLHGLRHYRYKIMEALSILEFFPFLKVILL
jgi:hypothetical protein